MLHPQRTPEGTPREDLRETQADAGTIPTLARRVTSFMMFSPHLSRWSFADLVHDKDSRVATGIAETARAKAYSPDPAEATYTLGNLRLDPAVPDPHDPPAPGGDVGLVGDDDDGLALAVEVGEEVEDLVAGLGVEVAGGLVGQEERRALDQGAGDRHPLALAARHLVRAGGPSGRPGRPGGAPRRRGRGGRGRPSRSAAARRSAGPSAGAAARRSGRRTRSAARGPGPAPTATAWPRRGRRASTGPRWGRPGSPRMFISVDLPDPDGPMIATSSLAPIARSTPRRAWTVSAAHRVLLGDPFQLDEFAWRIGHSRGFPVSRAPKVQEVSRAEA